ncbi:MAG: BNR repeat-containing protein [Bacteroidaceae bacterium]|nr:BNR repeat-containing protein [Bacteroidaceae bacterium]
MKQIITVLVLVLTSVWTWAQENFKSNVVAQEGAWCWFADPRALHYENTAGTINATYLGYIDVHGNVMATQYDWLTGRKTDVLVRSYFQPDDHNNPTFLVLPDERVMIFYTRHTDEPRIWYRISRRPGDITALGEEKYLTTVNNTTYPSPFILTDDPTHIYLCWRGISWHPTLARLTMPDQEDNCKFDFGPRQIVQSTGARPYAKYQSNGKDKIYLAYTTGHPDNEQPDWLYFNVIDINKGQGPILRDINGKQLSIIQDGVFNVNKQSGYASSYPVTIVDNTANIRNWVWQIALDEQEHPVIAYPHIDEAKTSHVYWYARWTGTEWRRTWVQYAGHAFHQNWNQTERCYSGGMALDPDNPHDLYLSIPTRDGQYNKDGVYEIWRYTIDDDGKVAGSQQITMNSSKNNARPFILPGSKNAKMRLAWMQGDYYYWMVNKNYPLGYPTSILCDHEWEEELTPEEEIGPPYDCPYFGPQETIVLGFILNQEKYEGTLFRLATGLEYRINATTKCPEVVYDGKTYASTNTLYTSDDWANGSSGTNGDSHPTKLRKLVIALTYDGQRLIIYRNGLIDQVLELEGIVGDINAWDDTFNHTCATLVSYHAVASPQTVRALTKSIKVTNPNLPTALQNGDFEGAYSVQEGSGVSSDRAIYVPQGWTLERTGGNENDITALKAGDLYFSQFFGSLAKPASHGQQTYWIRQNWGTPTLTLSQEMRLPEGQYTLTCDLWKSGLGGDASVSVLTEDGPTVTSPSLENKTEWQPVTLQFQSDGQSSTTVRLTAMHNYSGTEKIIGFDNVVLTLKGGTSLGVLTDTSLTDGQTAFYDLAGRRISTPQRGLYIRQGQKVVVR